MAITKLSDSSITTGDKYISMLAGNSAYMPPSYESIASTTVGSGGSATVTFSSIPADYTHLQLRWSSRSTGSNSTGLKIAFDSADTSYWHLMYADGSSVLSTAESATEPRIGNFPLANMTANSFGTGITDILDYKNTNKYKTLRSLSGYDNNGNGYTNVYSGLWKSTSAITTITLSNYADSFAEYSVFALYGIKGA